MSPTVRSSKKTAPKIVLLDSGVWAATALYLRCARCQTEAELPNPERKSLMMLVIEAETENNWYIPMGGGPVLCPTCHRQLAQGAGVETFIAPPSFTHVVDSKGTVRPAGPKSIRETYPDDPLPTAA